MYVRARLWAPLSHRKEPHFRLWSPFADAVTLNLYRQGSGAEAFEKHCMIKGEKGIWEYRTQRNLHEIYYDFTLQMEGRTVFSADPYARACGINGQRSMAVDLGKTDPEGWQEDRPPALEQETVIYELHVKEFSWDRSGGFPEETRGKYTAFLHTDTTLDGDGVHPTGISYLKELGVNYIQLMPVYDYGSVDETGKGADFNWGYDPVNYNVPEGSYSTDPSRGEVRIRELKEMIQSLHAQGFRIIMDVVYNHTYSLDSWFQRTVPWYFYRVNEDGTASNGSACGNDVASEREMCAKYILESVLYWAQEYHMDGFRFDLMGLLDVDLMNRIRAALDERYGKGEKILFGEPWAADRTAMEQEKEQALKQNIHNLDKNTGMFCDNTRDAIKGSALELKEPGFVNGAPGMETEILNSVQGLVRRGRTLRRQGALPDHHLCVLPRQPDTLGQTFRDYHGRGAEETGVPAGCRDLHDLPGKAFPSVRRGVCPVQGRYGGQLQRPHRDQPSGLEKGLAGAGACGLLQGTDRP